MGMFEEYIELCHKLPSKNGFSNKLEDVKNLQAQAMGYVWGWQDNSMTHDARVCEDFAYAYGVHAAKFALEEITSRMPIRDAFQAFIKTGEIRKYGEF